MKRLFYILTAIVGTTTPALAYKGSVSFTDAEKANHASQIRRITDVAESCLEDHYADHLQFFAANKVSKYFGNRRYIKGEVPGKRRDGATLTPIRPELRKRGIPVALESQLTNISCIDLARRCLKLGFEAANQGEYWARIDAFNLQNDNIGTIVQVGLQAIGWKLLYWNPDVSQNAAWDKADKVRTPTNPLNVWGQHSATYATVKNKGIYYQYRVDDQKTLVNFKDRIPESFMRVPFFVGTAHIGYHVFVGGHGQVIEAHSMRSLFGLDNLERNMFNPMSGGAPMSTRTEIYRSGIIVVPPTYL